MTADAALNDMPLPVIALVGRPNVGKSTLFNALTRSRDALVADVPGLTRDRQYGLGKLGTSTTSNERARYIVVDTGGLGASLAPSQTDLDSLVTQQALAAAGEADAVLFLVDGRAGLNSTDEQLAARLRRLGRPLYLVINKTEHMDAALVSAEFHALGLGEPITISASHQRGLHSLISAVLGDALEPDEAIPSTAAADADDTKVIPTRLRLAIVGRPNVGKSTLVNRLLGEQRVLAFDQPGTTRDSIAIPFDKDQRRYTLIDTAGVRRRSRVDEAIEKFSVIKTLQAIERSHVVVMMLDARQGIAEQDATLLGLILDSGRALVLAVNKWDKLDGGTRDSVKSDLARKLSFLDFAETHFISALHGSKVTDVLAAVDRAYAAATRKISTPRLMNALSDALAAHQPPLVRGQSIKLRYAHQGGQNPPLIIIHGNRTEHVPAAYKRYLANVFRKQFKLYGTPVRIEFKAGNNPFKPTKPRPHHRIRPLTAKQSRKKLSRRG